MPGGDTPGYLRKRAFFNRVITVYGRNAVLEALQDETLECYRLHLADSNKPAPVLQQLESIAQRRGIETLVHNRRELSRISRNGKQDQGVAADILCPGFRNLQDYLEHQDPLQPARLLAADGITNPQNAGMLVRSALAGGIDGIIWPDTGNTALGPLAIKASAGTLYRAPLLRCEDLVTGLAQCQQAGFRVCTLDAKARQSLFEVPSDSRLIFVLGNESEGISSAVSDLADMQLRIPMQNNVESLNVAVTAALIAYLDR